MLLNLCLHCFLDPQIQDVILHQQGLQDINSEQGRNIN